MNYVVVRRRGVKKEYLMRGKIMNRRMAWTEEKSDPKVNVFGTEMGALKAASRLLEREGILATIEETDWI